eukprot:TRINITY_DN18438_c0_g1_i1.p1 TRINITY_DN18438_c0_g1~~TRINITY_DN18438_c0_g1_i1.p1  ORF type:complete len:642 (+),score=71.73 TRINITY_DN18438_c0_g1_i1:99-2024(+)
MRSLCSRSRQCRLRLPNLQAVLTWVTVWCARWSSAAADATWLPKLTGDGITSLATDMLERGRFYLLGSKSQLLDPDKDAFLTWSREKLGKIADDFEEIPEAFLGYHTHGQKGEDYARRLTGNLSLTDTILNEDAPISTENIDAALKELREHVAHVRSVATDENLLDRPAALDAKHWLEDEEEKLRQRAEQKSVELNNPDVMPSKIEAAEPALPDPADMPLWGVSPREYLPENDPTGKLEMVSKKYKKKEVKRYDKSICAGQIIETTMWASEITLQIFGAIRECSPDKLNAASGDFGVQQSLCSRQIFVIIRAITRVVRGSLIAHAACSGGNVACPNAIADIVSRASFIGEFASRMGYWCRSTQFDATDRRAAWICGERLELTLWALGPFMGDFTRAGRVCIPDPTTGKVLLDYGWCVGEVLSTVGYVCATGLELWYAPAACPLSGARCSESIFEGLHALSLGAEKADLAAGFCGGFNTRCGSDIALAAATLLKVGVYAARIARQCPEAVAHRTQTKEILCTDAITNLVKFLSVTAAKAMDAAGRCSGDTDATQQCGSSITKALAAFAFIADQIALAVNDCREEVFNTAPRSFYNCGRNMDRIGYSSRIVTQAIAAASINCGLGREINSITKPLPLPARFYI